MSTTTGTDIIGLIGGGLASLFTAGRAIYALLRGHNFVGIIQAVFCGTNTPPTPRVPRKPCRKKPSAKPPKNPARK